MTLLPRSLVFSSLPLITYSALTLSACRVVEGPLNFTPNSNQSSVNQNIRENIQPAIKSLANTVDTIGKVYRASMTLSGTNGDQAAEGAIFDGAKLFVPSAEDELILTPHENSPEEITSVISNNKIVSSKSSTSMLAATNLNGTTQETYDFTYSLVNAQSVDLPDPTLKLTVEAKGTVDVIEGKAFFKDVTISAAIRSTSSEIVSGPFIIANMTVSYDNAHSFKVSFSDYIKLIKTINSNTDFGTEAQGTIELLVTKVDATLTVKKLLINRAAKFNVESLSGYWEFAHHSFSGEAKITVATKENEQLGVDVLFDDDARVTTKVFKRETLPTE